MVYECPMGWDFVPRGWDFFPMGWDICSQGVGQEVLMKNEECIVKSEV